MRSVVSPRRAEFLEPGNMSGRVTENRGNTEQLAVMHIALVPGAERARQPCWLAPPPALGKKEPPTAQ